MLEANNAKELFFVSFEKLTAWTPPTQFNPSQTEIIKNQISYVLI
jgi:hypothetical protein